VIRSLRGVLIALMLLLASAVSLAAHDLFLKLDSYFVRAGSTVRVHVLNGTFTKSEGSVARDRLRDISLVGPSGRSRLDTSAWLSSGDSSALTVQLDGSGTYVIGASVSPRTLRLEAKDFNQYLAEDGIADVLVARRAKGELDRPARERYSKHVKALVQVGESRSASVDVELGYPAELVPLDNPYTLRPGGALRVRALVDGHPIGNQAVLVGGHSPTGKRFRETTVRTDEHGVARVAMHSRGVWYVKFIRMVPVSAAVGDSVDYESKWATLTFAIR
jgi:hypothetical protein